MSEEKLKISQLSDMVKGWFIGNFSPTLYRTNDVEVAVKSYKKGSTENSHYHKLATEFTVIIEGKARMSGQILTPGAIVRIDPFVVTDFEALTDVTTVVVKLPGANNDKYEE